MTALLFKTLTRHHPVNDGQSVMDKETCLQSCTVEGLIIKLPDYQLERKVYQEVAKSLELIGGKWKGGKVMGFIFNEDPTELLAQIANGENRNLKKEYQFYATPDSIADWLVQLADIKPEHNILEPSAGQGAIINAVRRVLPEQKQPAPAKPKIITGLIVVDYSEKAIAVFGDTKLIKEQLIAMHGAFCRHLRYNNEPTPGWVFSRKREEAVRQLIA